MANKTKPAKAKKVKFIKEHTINGKKYVKDDEISVFANLEKELIDGGFIKDNGIVEAKVSKSK